MNLLRISLLATTSPIPLGLAASAPVLEANGPFADTTAIRADTTAVTADSF